MRNSILGFALLTCAIVVPTGLRAQTMNLEEFVVAANAIPQNPTALLRSDFRRVRREFEAGFRAVVREQRSAREAGRPPTVCFPGEIELSPQDMLRRLNAIPQTRRRSMTITDGVREVMRRRYPCPGD
jgi:hypothetical protein